MTKLRDRIVNSLFPLVLLGSIGTVVYLSNENQQLRAERSGLQQQVADRERKLESAVAIAEEAVERGNQNRELLICVGLTLKNHPSPITRQQLEECSP